ncbi:MAG: hypothetical protein J5707_01965, partial [Candidatus Methanomethylophilus sp.]|nr:hypothetical protein [Methanomethylophilus sp.]
MNDGTNSYSARLPDVTVSGSEYTGDTYQTALGNACTAAGLTATFGTYNMLSSIVANAVTYGSSGTWGGNDYYNFAVYYKNNGAWKDAYLNEGGVYVIVFDKYEFTEPTDVSKYYKSGDELYGYYWTLLPTVGLPV